MNIFLKQATRRPLFTTLLVLLLSFSVLLSCTGYSAWESAKTQKNEISNGYTTIAIPIEPDLSNLSPEEIATALQNRVFADNAAQEAPQITMVDRRCLLSAHIAGSRSLSSSSIDPSDIILHLMENVILLLYLHCAAAASGSSQRKVCFCMMQHSALRKSSACQTHIIRSPDLIRYISTAMYANRMEQHRLKKVKPILCSANTKIIVSFGPPMGMIR